jgi:hypothetical protein
VILGRKVLRIMQEKAKINDESAISMQIMLRDRVNL